jgi:hypothetical protein
MTTIQQMFFFSGYSLVDGIVRSSTDFSLGTTSGNTYTFLGASSATYSIGVLDDPNGTKSIRFPITYSGTSFLSDNQFQSFNFTPLSTTNYNILNDIFYIFRSGLLGVSGIYGASESSFDFYSMSFNSNQIFRVSGNVNDQYYRISPFNPASLSNSGQIVFQTDGSVNRGDGLYPSSYGGNSYFYFSI